MTAREFLALAGEADAQVLSLMAQISHMQAIRARGERVLGEGWPDGSCDCQIAALETQLEHAMEQWREVRGDVIAAIAAVKKANHRQLLEYKHLCGWDMTRIAIRMNYSLDRIWHLHGDALREFVVPEKYRNRKEGFSGEVEGPGRNVLSGVSDRPESLSGGDTNGLFP